MSLFMLLDCISLGMSLLVDQICMRVSNSMFVMTVIIVVYLAVMANVTIRPMIMDMSHILRVMAVLEFIGVEEKMVMIFGIL